MTEPVVSRREVLRSGMAIGAAAAAHPVLNTVRPPASAGHGDAPHVVIVGAGAAGVRCAHRLWTKWRVTAQVFDANAERLGGRTFTLRGFFAGGRWAEQGGAFISSEHRAVRALCARFGLRLEVVNGGAQPQGTEIYSIDGATYRYTEALADWKAAYPAFARAARLGGRQRWDVHTPAGTALDHQSVPEWLERSVAGGASSRFGKLMLSNVISEYGGDPEDQSALNLVSLLSGNSRGHLDPLAGTDERYHIAQGSDALVAHMLGDLPGGAGSVTMGARLIAVQTRADGRPVCTFEQGERVRDVTADHLVLALPFSVLREVDLRRAQLSGRKRQAIAQLGMGSNAKIQLQLADRPWIGLGLNGVAYSQPGGFDTVWDGSSADLRPLPLLVDFTGGRQGGALTGAAFGPAHDAEVARLVTLVEQVFPGTELAWQVGPRRAWRSAWHLNPWSKGSYAYWRPGQYTAFAGSEGLPEGRIHFAGEHTSFRFQGYIEGAVRSGARAAAEIAGA